MNGLEMLREFPLAEGVAGGTDSGSESFGVSRAI